MKQATIRNRYVRALGALAALCTLYAGEAHALCEQISDTDSLGVYNALNNLPASGSNAWIAFHNHHYNTPEVAWNHVGYRTAWNDPPPDPRNEYIKHVLSSLLTEKGVYFEQPERFLVRWDGQLLDLADGSSRAFHSNEDYSAIARGRRTSKTFLEVRSLFLGDPGLVEYRLNTQPWGLFTTLLIDEVDPEGAFAIWIREPQGNPWYRRTPVLQEFFSAKPINSTVTTFCSLYNSRFPVGTTAFRASALVHEGWHSRNWEPMTSHVRADAFAEWTECGESRQNGENCDIWHPHGKLDFDSGDTFFAGGAPLFVQTVRKRPPLSAYQIQTEFLCDLADNGQPWLPINIAMAAAAGSENFYGDNPFVNIEHPQYSCGMPTPLYAVPVGSRTNECPAVPGGDGIRCDDFTDCPEMPFSARSCTSGCCVYQVVR